ncbi:MAG: hypothetical protein AAFR34_08590, partial [Pseudomonadota bacterium]
FANFSHAELLSLGAYAALVFDALVGALVPVFAVKLAPLSLTTSLIIAILISMVITGVSALLMDRRQGRQLHRKHRHKRPHQRIEDQRRIGPQ